MFGVFFSAFWATAASAHNSIVGSSPAEGEVVASSPPSWTVSFASEVPLDSASGEIVRADGSRVPLGAPAHGATTSTVVFALPGDLSGPVTARWRLVGVDGHVISGRISFTVGGTSTRGAPTNTGEADGGAVLSSVVKGVLRAANYAGILAVGGLLLAEALIVRGAISGRIPTTTLVAGAATVTVVPLIQTVQFASELTTAGSLAVLSGLGDALSLVPGQMSSMRSVFGLVLLGVSWNIVRSPVTRHVRAVAVAAGGGYLVTLAYGGHSRSMDTPWLGIPVDVAHTAAVVYWLGGMAVLLLVVAPVLDDGAAVAAWRRFGAGARVAVPVIIVTGMMQTARLHGGIATLVTTSHGRILLAKIAAVAAMLKFADSNRRRLASPVTSADDRRLRRDLTSAALAETAVGLVVVAVTAVLVTSSLS